MAETSLANRIASDKPMKPRFWPKRWWMRCLIVFAAVLFLPYISSRIASNWRTISVYSSANAYPASHDDNRLRIVSFNIAHGRGVADSNWQGGTQAERLTRLKDIAKLLRVTNGDVVVLNEVDFETSWSGGVNQAEYLAREAGYPYRVEQRNLDFRVLLWTWRFGNAVLSRHPIKHVQVVDLPGYSDSETVFAGQKRAFMCDVEINGRTIRVIAAHLCHRSERVRTASAEMLGDLSASSDYPTFVVGDLNSTPTDFPDAVRDETGRNAMESFDSSGRFQRRPESPPTDTREFTFHTFKPTRVIDWILIPPDWKYEKYTVDQSELSDHRLIWAEVTAPNK